MKSKRVMVVDDSAIIRRLVCEIFSGHDDVECSSAPNGMIAIEKVSRINPDLIILDVEMPGLGGLETLERLLGISPRLHVIMFSSSTDVGAGVSMEALSRGAADCLAKPSTQGSGPLGMEFLLRELLPRVESLLGLTSKTTHPAATVHGSTLRTAPYPPSPPSTPSRNGKFDILAIASSTGGPNALHTFFEGLPPNLPIPVVGVQHMPPVFTRLLAERLTQKTRHQVREATSGEPLMPGTVYLAPGDFHLELVRDGQRTIAALRKGALENSCRPAADVLFRSVAKLFGSQALGLVLTGMGQDGLLGCKDIKQEGGYLLAQDEASSVVWGMPGAIARAGLADEVLPLSSIAGRVGELLARRK